MENYGTAGQSTDENIMLCIKCVLCMLGNLGTNRHTLIIFNTDVIIDSFHLILYIVSQQHLYKR